MCLRPLSLCHTAGMRLRPLSQLLCRHSKAIRSSSVRHSTASVRRGASCSVCPPSQLPSRPCRRCVLLRVPSESASESALSQGSVRRGDWCVLLQRGVSRSVCPIQITSIDMISILALLHNSPAVMLSMLKGACWLQRPFSEECCCAAPLAPTTRTWAVPCGERGTSQAHHKRWWIRNSARSNEERHKRLGKVK
jgi:hypothetical protein